VTDNRFLTTTESVPVSLVTTEGNAYPVMPSTGGGSPTPPVPPLYSVVFRPGDASGADNVFTSWGALVAATAGIEGGVRVTVDDTLGACNVPAGTYAVDNWILSGVTNPLDSAGFSTLTLADGVHFTATRLDVELLTVEGTWTSTVLAVPLLGELWLFLAKGAQILALGASPFVSTPSSGFTDVFLDQAASLGDGTHFVVTTGVGSANNCFVILNNGSTLTQDSVSGTGVIVEYDSTCSVNNTQGAGVGFTQSSVASFTEFAPSVAGNWNPVPNNVASALNLLAAANSVATLDPGQGAAAAITLPGSAIAKAKSGRVLINVTASFNTSLSTVNVTLTLKRDGVTVAGAPVPLTTAATAGLGYNLSLAWTDTLPDTAAHT